MHFCFAFAMDILSLHWGNISVDIRIGDNLTDEYLKGCTVIREKQALSWRMHLLAVEDAICGMRRMGWTSYPSVSQHSSHFLCNRTSQSSVAYCAHAISVSFLTRAKVAAADKHARVPFPRRVLRKTVCTHHILCRGEACRRMFIPGTHGFATM
jgi:hypothetical protein